MWLPQSAAIEIAYGRLPEGSVIRRNKPPILRCPPPPHLAGTKEGKARDVEFREDYRCERMRCCYLDSEGTIDHAWAVANGVDPAMVLLIGGQWAEQSLESVEEAMLTKEFDFTVIDSTSVLEPKKELEKSLEDKRKVGARAMLTGQFARRMISAAAEDGLTARYRPTILATSQATTMIGSSMSWLASTDGNAFDHACSLDLKMEEAGYTYNKERTKSIFGKFAFEVKRNKAGGTQGATGEVKFWLTPTADHAVGDSDDLATVMDCGRELGAGFINEDSDEAPLVLHTPYVADGKITFRRVCDLEDFLKANDSVYEDLRDRVLTALRAKDSELVLSSAVETPAIDGAEPVERISA
jgi:hypothetical protein